MSIVGFNVMISARPPNESRYSRDAVTATVDSLVSGTLTQTFSFENADGSENSTAPYKLSGPTTRVQLSSVSTAVNAIQMLVRRTGETGWRPWGYRDGTSDESYLVDTGGAVWKTVASPTDMPAEPWEQPLHGSVPWSDMKVLFKLIAPQSIVYLGPYNLVVQHSYA